MTRRAKGIIAAGGVVWRLRDGVAQVLVVHRPRYDDWTLPKGKLLAGETALLGAVREVAEETGASVAVEQRIGTVKYLVGGLRKKVTYWSMRYVSGDFAPNDEVDEIGWLDVAAAARKLNYDLDRSVLADFAGLRMADALIVLVRHAKAGKRTEWRGDDRLRPLDVTGEQQAAALATALSVFGPTEVYAADRTRCVQTVEPLAAQLGVTVQVEPAFADEQFVGGAHGTQTTLLALAKPGTVSIICSQGTTIPSLIDRLAPVAVSSGTRKAAWWVLAVVDGEVVAVDHYHPPLIAAPA